MIDLKEKILTRCIHFNGVMNKHCEAGIKYEDVIVGKPYKFPCLKQAGECSKCEFPSVENAEKQATEINELLNKNIRVLGKIKEHFIRTNKPMDKVPCECGGELTYIVSDYNGHIACACNACGISFRE